MKKSAFVSDIIFTFFSTFLFALCLFRYLKMTLLFATLLAISCGTLTTIAIACFLQSRRTTFFLKKADETRKEQLLKHLIFLSDEEKTKFFIEALSTPELPLKRFSSLRIYNNHTFYTIKFSYAAVNQDEVLRFSRLKTGKEKVILCNQMEEDALALSKKLSIDVYTGRDVYLLLKESEALPSRYLGTDAGNPSKNRRLQTWFSRANAKRFFTVAILLLLASIISPFPYYYLLFSGLLLLSSFLIRILGYK